MQSHEDGAGEAQRKSIMHSVTVTAVSAGGISKAEGGRTGRGINKYLTTVVVQDRLLFVPSPDAKNDWITDTGVS